MDKKLFQYQFLQRTREKTNAWIRPSASKIITQNRILIWLYFRISRDIRMENDIKTEALRQWSRCSGPRHVDGRRLEHLGIKIAYVSVFVWVLFDFSECTIRLPGGLNAKRMTRSKRKNQSFRKSFLVWRLYENSTKMIFSLCNQLNDSMNFQQTTRPRLNRNVPNHHNTHAVMSLLATCDDHPPILVF